MVRDQRVQSVDKECGFRGWDLEAGNGAGVKRLMME